MARPTFLSASDELFFDDTLDLSPRMPVVNQGFLYQNPWEVNQFTPPKINIEPENDDLEDDFPLPGLDSQVPC